MKSPEFDQAVTETTLWTLIRVGHQSYALPAEAIVQAMAAPARFPLPYAPPHVIGMAHFDGGVLPCIALDIAFATTDSAGTYNECIVVRHDNRQAMIMAESVVRHLSLANNNIHAIQRDDDNATSVAILGEISLDDQSVFLLDPAYLVSFSAISGDARGRPGLVDTVDDEKVQEEDEDSSFYLYIGVAGQNYAVDVSLVKEIISFDSVSLIPGAPGPVRGLSVVRSQSHLLVSTSQWLGLTGDVEPMQAIVVATPSGDILLDVDSVESVSLIACSSIRALNDVDSRLSGVIECEDQPLRGVLNIPAITRHAEELPRYIPKIEQRRESKQTEQLASYLLVRWEKELFAIELSDVIRLESDGFVRNIDDERFSAVFNFDGNSIPVIREDYFYGMPSDDSRREGYMVLGAEGSPYAVPLQNAENIISTARSNILKRGNQRDDRFAGTIRYNDKLVTLVNMAFFRQQAYAPQGTAP